MKPSITGPGAASRPERIPPFATPRIHFLDEQRRHRRTGAVSAALVVVVLAVSGIPLSIMISPLVVGFFAVLVRLADLVVDVPALSAWLDRVFHLLPTMWTGLRQSDVDLPWDWLVGLFVLPGVLLTLVLWALVRLIFRRTGVGGPLRRMETRPPLPGDLAEQRLANLVEEVAVAAGVPPPHVLLIDTPAANVGAAGLTMDNASVIVTRGFVDRLPRDAQQAVIAHVMSSVGNGDLTLAAEILTLLQTWGLITLLLEAPFLSAARASLVLVGRIGWRTVQGTADAPSRELALDHLLEGAGHELDMDSEELEMLPDWHPLALMFVYLPLLLSVAVVAIFAKTVIWLTALLMGPLVAFLWRTQRRLADATAVQLTRHPEALATALRTLAGLDMKVPGGVPVHFLFPVWDPEVDRDQTRTDVTSVLLRMQLPLEGRLRRLERLGGVTDRPAQPPSLGEVAREFAGAAGWLTVAALLLAVVLAASAFAAAGVLYGLGWLLDALLVALPRRIARVWG
ncbi:MAG TPA: M48 family metalloprotease [Gemmatimonadales bacterium]|nr:M48 family metalloprotease [Gemmatimonadales bacterium]